MQSKPQRPEFVEKILRGEGPTEIIGSGPGSGFIVGVAGIVLLIAAMLRAAYEPKPEPNNPAPSAPTRKDGE